MAAVSRLWCDLYANVPDTRILVKQNPNVDWRERHRDGQSFTCIPQMTLYSAVFGSASRVRLAHAAGVNCSTQVYQYAAGMHADIDALTAARELGMRFCQEVAIGAARCNTVCALWHLRAEGCPWHPKLCSSLAERGEFEALRWAREHRCDWYAFGMLSDAAGSGNIEMTAWVKQQQLRLPYRADSICKAARNGHTTMCEFLRAEQCPWNEYACLAAAYGGQVDTLRWLHEQGCPWYEEFTAEKAAEGGSIEVILYMRQAGVEFTGEQLTVMLNIAGAYNKLEAAQWLRQQGAEWPPMLMYKRYSTGTGLQWQGDALAWAREEGCTAPTA
jgi:hypothetical protein